MCTPSITSTLYRSCSLLSGFEYIDSLTCLVLSWASPFSPSKLAFTCGPLDPCLIHSYWAHRSPHPKRHLDRFSHFLQGLRSRERDRPTDHATSSMAIGRIWLVMRHNDSNAFTVLILNIWNMEGYQTAVPDL